MMMDFLPVSIKMKEPVQTLLFSGGERSCQHSFAALYAMSEKYRTSLCIQPGKLFIRQAAKDEGEYESFMMPFCQDPKEKRQAMIELLQDVHKRGKKLKLQTITASAQEFLAREFAGQFRITKERNYSEYLYTSEKLALLEGSEMKNIRQFYRRFWRRYNEFVIVESVEEKDIPEILEFQSLWLAKRKNSSDYEALAAEDRAIKLVCEEYGELGFKGIMVKKDGVLCGYALGCGISDETLDIFFEKGDRSVRDIYRCLVTDMVKIHGMDYKWINREEDLGDDGMRYSKMSYHPDILLEKYIAREV